MLIVSLPNPQKALNANNPLSSSFFFVLKERVVSGLYESNVQPFGDTVTLAQQSVSNPCIRVPSIDGPFMASHSINCTSIWCKKLLHIGATQQFRYTL